MDPALRRTATILFEVLRLTPQQLQLLLDGYINDPELQYGLTRFRRENLPHGHDYYIEPSTGECWRELQDYSLDHIIPSSLGGQHHPQNYFLMPREVNNYFGNSWTAKKVAYIGAGAALAAGSHRWHGLKIKESVRDHGLYISTLAGLQVPLYVMLKP
jgi:hypothetical protein